jgi:hypothetical protein
MRKIKSLDRLQYKRLLLSLAGVVFLVPGAALAISTLSKNAETAVPAQSTTPKSAKTAASPEITSPVELQKQSFRAAATAATDAALPAGEAPAASMSHYQKAKCDDIERRLSREYTEATAKAKADLDSRITYPLAGSTVINSYIGDYNKIAIDTFNKYSESAKKSNCSPPIKAPDVLPEDYLPSGY